MSRLQRTFSLSDLESQVSAGAANFRLNGGKEIDKNFKLPSRISNWLIRNNLNIDVWMFIILILILISFILIVCLFFKTGILLFIIFSSVFIFLIYIVIDYRGRRASSLKELQMEEFIIGLTGNLYSNPNLLLAIQKTVIDVEDPLKKEFGAIVDDCRRGLNLKEAFENFLLKNRSKLIQVVITGLVAANDKGGDLIGFLKDQLDYLRERKNLNSYIRILSTGPRYTSYIIAVLPLLVIIVSMFINRELSSLFVSGAGLFVLIYVCISYSVGFLLINKIVNISDQSDKNIS